MTMMIKQRAAHDCGICSIAMATGRSYEEVIEAAQEGYRPNEGLYNSGQTLKRLGFNWSGARQDGDFVHLHRQVVSPEYFRQLAWGRKCLISVPSLNLPLSRHMIYYDGWTVYDPSNDLVYNTFNELLPEEIIMFREQMLPD